MAHRGKRRPSDHLAVQFLEGIPGLGPYRSSTLLKSAGSIRGVLNMSENELARHPGLGPATAKKIVDFLNKPFENNADGKR